MRVYKLQRLEFIYLLYIIGCLEKGKQNFTD